MAKDSAGFIKNAYLCHDFFPTLTAVFFTFFNNF